MMVAIFYGCLICLLTCIHTISADFVDCTAKRCCKAISDYDTDTCSSYGLSDCLDNSDICDWDCDSNSRRWMKDNGYTKRKFNKISKGDGVYNEDDIPDGTSSDHEPESVDEYIEMTKITSMDECGVVYDYEMDQENARRKFQRIKDKRRSNRGNRRTESNRRRMGIFGPDGRVQVTDINDNTEWVGYLEIQSTGSFCTATLIANRFIITAAHCVYALGGTWFSGFVFHPDTIDSTSWAANSIGYSYVYTFAAWTNPTPGVYTGDYDIAWIELNQDVNFGYLALGSVNWGVQGYVVNIVGYPGDKPWATKWSQTCSITTEQQVTAGELSFASQDCDGAGGMSGSAVYLDDHEIIGIYWGGDGRGNAYAQITPSKHSAICAAMDITQCQEYRETYPTLCASISTQYPWIIIGYENRFEFAGKYNGKPYYKQPGVHQDYLFWTNSAYKWMWSPELGGGYFAYTITDNIDGAVWSGHFIDLSSYTCSSGGVQSQAAKNDGYFNFDMSEYTNDLTSSGYGTYMIWGLIILTMINCVCMTIYCWNKTKGVNKSADYGVVKYESESEV